MCAHCVPHAELEVRVVRTHGITILAGELVPVPVNMICGRLPYRR